MIEPMKYLIQPVAVERDPDTGRITREIPGEVITVYNAAQAAEAIVEFEAQLERLNQEGGQDASSGSNGVADQLRQREVSGERVGSA